MSAFPKIPLRTMLAVSELVGGDVITQQPVILSTVHKAFGCRDRLPFSQSGVIVAVKEGFSLTSSQSLMTHHYQRGQGSSLVTNVFSYACIYYRCQYYVPQFVMLCAVLKGKGIKPMLFCLLESKVFSQSLFLASTLL